MHQLGNLRITGKGSPTNCQHNIPALTPFVREVYHHHHHHHQVACPSSGEARNLRQGVRNCVLFSILCTDFLIQTFSNYRRPSVSFPAVSFFGDCSHAYSSCDLPKTLWFEKRKTSTAQAHDTFCHLVLIDYRSYDRARFTYKSLRNHVQKYYVFFSQEVRTHPMHIVCLRHCALPTA